jgi:acyl-CoA reductase-like NAD-dependent aldehyde dehydrogenase
VFAGFNLAFCIQVLREAAAAITRTVGELLPTSIPGAYSMAQRISLGVVAAISPWNAPLVLGMRSIAIPLAVGNTVVMKPSEDAPITCGLLLADVLAEAGLPAGVLNVVTNDLADAGDVVAAAKGATLLTGDGEIEGPNGTLIRPVVLTDVTTDMDIFRSEIFGPEQRWITIQHNGRPAYPF